MIRVSRGLVPIMAALAFGTVSASAGHAQVVCYQPAPIVAAAPAVSYYTPAPVVSYYAAPAPAVTYYAPAPVVSYYAAPAPVYTSYYVAPAAVTTYRYGPLGRLRSVRTYYGY
jgi:hypothetical protein